jgi:hypothetical protein
MIPEVGDFFDVLIEENGEPQDFGSLMRMISQSCLAVMILRQHETGPDTIQKTSVPEIMSYIDIKTGRVCTLSEGGKRLESLLDNLGDGANYFHIAFAKSTGRWGLPVSQADLDWAQGLLAKIYQRYARIYADTDEVYDPQRMNDYAAGTGAYKENAKTGRDTALVT